MIVVEQSIRRDISNCQKSDVRLTIKSDIMSDIIIENGNRVIQIL